MMDAVITYVDSADITWQNEYNKFVKRPLEECLNRFRSYGVLDLQIKLIRKFLPFVDKVFVIVSSMSQVPDLVKGMDGVHIVLHKEIIPKMFLPCFNSCTIEMFFQNITSLSEQFLYFNDDIFPVHACKEEDFFSDGKVRVNYKLCTYDEDNATIFQKNVMNSTSLFYKKNEILYNGIKPEHSVLPMLKSACKETFDSNNDKILKSLSRTRHSKNINVYAPMIYLFKANKRKISFLGTKYFYTTSIEFEKLCSELDETIHFICINDNDLYNDFDGFKIELRVFLECLLEDKPYEASKVEELISKEHDENKKGTQYSVPVTDILIVSFTSWTKRIKYCKHTVDLMMNQTVLPNKIILNLAEEEFQNKEKDLPNDLVEEAINNELFEIYWVKENTTVWKKIIPTMDRFPNDLVFSIDDDIEYPSNYIEEMHKTYLKYSRNHPVVAYKSIQHGLFFHSGPFTLTSRRFYGEHLSKIYENLVHRELKTHNWQSDSVYSYAALLNSITYVPCNTINGNMLYKNSSINNENAYSDYKSDEWKESFNRNMCVLNEYVTKNYGRTLEDLVENNSVIVNFTTWKKRDKYTIKLLECFKKQTIRPMKIICWLSKDEYNGKMPKTIKECLNRKLLSEVKWVNGNTYSHKRWETFKENMNYYNVMIDDDIYYPEDYIEKLLETSKKYPGAVVCYYTRTIDYNNGNRLIDNYVEEPSLKNGMYSGLSCYPPNIFPYESFNYQSFRDEYCKYCDDSWVGAWLLKNNIKVVGVQEWFNGCLNEIDGTPETGIWINHNSKKINGIMQKYINQVTAFKVVGVSELATKLWPSIHIEKYAKNVKYIIK